MWHEARKQEKIIRGIIVDYRRRAERRKNFYEKIKADPTQFIQIYGRPCKIHLDPAVATAVDSPGIMMPWQGDPTNLIDRFDVRAHLDYIPEVKSTEVNVDELSQEERQFNYERYRILAQNNFLGLSEAKFLQQLAVEEKFGMTHEEREAAKEKSNEKKGTGAAIGYNYSDPSSQPSSSTGPESKSVSQKDSDNESDFEILDVDLSIDVNKMEASQAHELNAVGPLYGMTGCDMFSFLTGDADDVEHQKQMLREEKERAMFSGRKSRRERRAHRDKKLNTRVGQSPPSYAAPSTRPYREESRSPSRSVTPPVGDSIEFITSFGGEEEEKPPATKPSYAEKVKKNLKPLYADVARNTKKSLRSPSRERNNIVFGPHKPTYSRSPSRSRSRSRSYSRSVSKSRSRSRSKYRSYSRSRSRSYSRGSYRGKSRSRSPNYGRRKRSRSISSDSESRGGVSKCLPRYYGRKKDDKASSSELSIDSQSTDDEASQKQAGNGGISNSNQSHLRSGSSNKGSSRDALSLKDKLKKKMQAQLSRQLRQDQRQEAERTAREERRQARREHEIRLLALKLRRKQREMRHQQRGSSYDSDSSGSGSPNRKSQDKDKKSESRSPSPPKKKIPVWTTDEVQPEYGCENRPYSYQEEGENKYHQSAPRYPETTRQNVVEETRYDYSESYREPVHFRPEVDPQKYSDKYREDIRYNRQPESVPSDRYREPRPYTDDGGQSYYERNRQSKGEESRHHYTENKTEDRQNYTYPKRYNETYPERYREEYKQNRGMDEHKQNFPSARYDQREFDNKRQEASQGTSSQWGQNEYNRQSNSFRGDFNKGFGGNDRRFNSQRNHGEGPSWKQNRGHDGKEENRDSKRVKLVDY